MKSRLIDMYRFLGIILMYCASNVNAQFSDSFTIHYTKTTNIHKLLPNEPWAENMKKGIPKFKKDHYVLCGKAGVSTYKMVPLNDDDDAPKIPEWLVPESGNEVTHYPDSFKIRKDVMGLQYLLTDSNISFNWKITNDKRNIAGYNCRKAIAKFQDTILIYAFYAEELIGDQGPEIVHGLPGAILGMGIPQMNLTWFADKVELHAKGFSSVVKPKKKEKLYNKTSLHKEMEKLFQGQWDKRAEKMYWGLFF